MFVKNTTSIPVELPRGEFLDGISVAAVVATVPFRITARGLERWEGTRTALPTDPPKQTDRALWEGTSVTVAGTVLGPGCPPHATRVTLGVGEASRALVVFGDRRWTRNAGKLVASIPAPWESLHLSWEHAFGGSFEIPPGPFGPSKLPHPGGRFSHALNPHGKGICLDDTSAEGRLLPNIESPTEQMRRPTDQPRPAGFAPCPDLMGLRTPTAEDGQDPEDPEHLVRAALRMAHPAPQELIFRALAEGTAIDVTGVGKSAIRFEIPRCPFQVTIRKGRSATPIAGAVRCVHASVDDGAVLVTYGYSFCYEVAPSWVEVVAS